MDLNKTKKKNERKIEIMNGIHQIIKTFIRTNEHNFYFNVSMDKLRELMKRIFFLN
jgi:hypothetical protein